MKYELKEKNSFYQQYDYRIVDLTNNNKKEVDIGSIVIPNDGSWSIILENGEQYHDPISQRPIQERWRVICIGGDFPKEPRMCESTQPSKHWKNDTLMVSVENPNRYAFINKDFLRVV